MRCAARTKASWLPCTCVSPPQPNCYPPIGTGKGRGQNFHRRPAYDSSELFTVMNCKLLFKITSLKIPRHLATDCQPSTKIGTLISSPCDFSHSAALDHSDRHLCQKKYEQPWELITKLGLLQTFQKWWLCCLECLTARTFFSTSQLYVMKAIRRSSDVHRTLSA